MRLPFLPCCMALLIGTQAARAAPASQMHTADLTCGAGSFRLKSTEWSDRAAPLAPIAQALAVAVGNHHRLLRLEEAGEVMVDGWRVRRQYVISWACETASTGRSYVSLGYACAVDPGDEGSCGADKEWFRLLDDHGRLLDAGLPHDGAPEERLETRLGLKTVSEAGVSMTEVLGK